MMPIRKRGFVARVLGVVLLAIGITTPLHAEVIVFAAASTWSAMNDISALYTSETSKQVRISFASSSILAKQIENGAPADIYISANTDWMDYLAKRQFIVSESRTILATNRLVLVAPINSNIQIRISQKFPLVRALGDDRLAMGDPDHVPAGIYGKIALTGLGIWESIVPKIVRALDVRAALVLVQRGEVGAGIVYATDAIGTKNIRVVDIFPNDSHPPITYPAAIITGHARPESKHFFKFLTSKKATSAFISNGFKAGYKPTR